MKDETLQNDSAIDQRPTFFSTVIGITVLTLGGAIFGAVFVALFLQTLLRAANMFLRWRLELAHPYLYAAVAGGIIGAVVAYRNVRQRLRLQAGRQNAAQELGFRYSDRAEEEVIERLREFFHPSDRCSFSFRNVIERKVGAARLLVGEVDFEDSSRTVAYFESDQLTLPPFTLQPEGFATKLGSMLGVPRIDFESPPDFSRYYHLGSRHPEQARLLFNDALLTYFAQHPGLMVRSQDNRLIFCQSGRSVNGVELEDFMRQAIEVFEHFQEAAAAARGRMVQVVKVNPHRAAEQPGGLASLIRCGYRVARQDLDLFLAQTTPRDVPPNIFRQQIGSSTGFPLFVGAFFAVGGLLMGIMGTLATGPWNKQRIVPIAMGLAFSLLIGIPMTFFVLRYRRRTMWLLRNGIITSAVIERVDRTNFYVNDQRRYAARFRFRVDGAERTARCNLYGIAAREAEKFVKTGVPVRVLYDPLDPSRIIWAESLITDSQEYGSPQCETAVTIGPID